MRSTNRKWCARWQPWLWFIGLYLASLLVFATVTSLLHLIIWR